MGLSNQPHITGLPTPVVVSPTGLKLSRVPHLEAGLQAQCQVITASNKTSSTGST